MVDINQRIGVFYVERFAWKKWSSVMLRSVLKLVQSARVGNIWNLVPESEELAEANHYFHDFKRRRFVF